NRVVWEGGAVAVGRVAGFIADAEAVAGALLEAFEHRDGFAFAVGVATEVGAGGQGADEGDGMDRIFYGQEAAFVFQETDAFGGGFERQLPVFGRVEDFI